MSWQCYLLQATGHYRRFLRRFAYKAGSSCPDGKIHDAMVFLDVVDHQEPSGDSWPHDDPRWPKTCEKCGYEFKPGDEWQLLHQELFRLPDGREVTLDEAPAGGMMEAPWYLGEGVTLEDLKAKPNLWGMSSQWRDKSVERGSPLAPIVVKLPDGTPWCYMQGATNGAGRSDGWRSGWDFTGEPPNITCSPSIASGDYHGFLRNGVLTDDLGRRTYPEH